jgi:hypothetical protein
MKLTIILLLITSSLFGQIPKGATTISIVGDSTTEEKIAEALITNGFNIQTINKYTIKTETKKIKTWNFDVIVSMVGNKYTFKIYWASNISVYVGGGVSTGPQRGECSYKGFNSSAYKVGFNELDYIVNSLGYPVTYN